MLAIFITLLLMLVAAGQPHDIVNSAILGRQTQASISPDCNATCTAFAAVKKCHGDRHCKCSNRHFQAEGDCRLCKTSTPEDAAEVKFSLDEEIYRCLEHGIPVKFKLQLPADAQTIVDYHDRHDARRRINQSVFLALQIAGGHVGLVILLAFAVFSRSVCRDSTFINFCITWIFSSVVYSLLLYRGTRGNSFIHPLGHHVSHHTCLLQASLTNGAQVMTACSTMALVIQLWIRLRAAIHEDHSYTSRQKRWATFVLLALPYVLFLTFAIPSAFVGGTHIIFENSTRRRAKPSKFYCFIIGLNPFLRAIYGVTLGLLIVTVVFDALIIVILYRNWWAFRHIQTKSSISLSILLRVMVFSVYRVVVAVAYGTVLNTPSKFKFQSELGHVHMDYSGVPVWVDMLQAAIPLIGFLVLGINSDMFTKLIFWWRDRRLISAMQRANILSSGTSTVITWNKKAVVNLESEYVSGEV